jgi:hypothetical protein
VATPTATTPTATTPGTSVPTAVPTNTAPGPGTPGSTGSAPAGGQERIRVPGNFTIRAGGVLSPRTVSAPAFLAIQMKVISRDKKPDHVQVLTQHSYSFTVPPGGRVSKLIRGQRQGNYTILVNNAVRGFLLIGGEPGP